MDANCVHDERGQTECSDGYAKHSHAHFALALDHPAKRRENFATKQDDERGVKQPATYCENGNAWACAKGCQHHRQHAPRYSVVKSTGGK